MVVEEVFDEDPKINADELTFTMARTVSLKAVLTTNMIHQLRNNHAVLAVCHVQRLRLFHHVRHEVVDYLC